ncbi:hypothetical protein ACSBR1_021151 [Camellia fascicularis]
MTMTPYDFAMITGLGVRGDLIPFDMDMGEWEAAWIHLLGACPPLYRLAMVRYNWFAEHFRGSVPETPEEVEQYVRDFLMFLLGTTLFANKWNTVGLYLLSALMTLPRVRFYNWGGAGFATLYGYMSSTSRMRGKRVGGYWKAWELWVSALHFLFYICSCIVVSTLHFLFYICSRIVDNTAALFLQLWVYAYFPVLAPELVEDISPVVPYSRRYDGRC